MQERLTPLGFRPVSKEAEADWRVFRPKDRVFGLQPMEILVSFQEARVSAIKFFFHSRGDQGVLSETDFRSLVTQACEGVTHWAGTTGQPRREERRAERQYVSGRTWIRGDLQLDMEWAWSTGEDKRDFRSEYLKAVLQLHDPSKRAVILSGYRQRDSGATGIKLLTLPELRKRVERRLNSDVVIPGVPMVDQGEKGYCAVATVERLLRFYGLAVDQHTLAQWAGSDAERGTEPQALIGALRRMASQTRLRVVALRDLEATSDWRDGHLIVRMPKNLLDLIRVYNRLARREKAPELTAANLSKSGSIANVYRMMIPELLRQAKLSDEAGRNRFMMDVQQFIDAGVPLVWGVTVGLVSEKEIVFSGSRRGARPGNRGEPVLEGHLRLITGYNSKTGEILYSDTWGVGHEEKRMPLNDAWMITEGLYAVIPSHIRL